MFALYYAKVKRNAQVQKLPMLAHKKLFARFNRTVNYISFDINPFIENLNKQI